MVSHFVKLIRRKKYFLVFIFLNFLYFNDGFSQLPRYFPPGVKEIYISDDPNVRADLLMQIGPMVERSIREGAYPGAVILAGYRDQIIYQGIFGNRRILPDVAPMTLDTIFDLASLTKVVVTTTAVMQLLEQGKIELDDPVAQYWPKFAANGKESITIRQLLTHTSGLPADIPSPLLNHLLIEANKASDVMPVNHLWQDEKGALQEVVAVKPLHPPGTTFIYSDIGFLALGHVVEIITGEQLDTYASEHIFSPLKMQHTAFLPPIAWKDKIAPTEVIRKELRWGEVHDPTAYQMGGVSGFAGLFGTAPDLSLFIRCLIHGGRLNQASNTNNKWNYLLAPLTILKMVTPQTPKNMQNVRGLGWDIASSFSNRGVLLPVNSFGHSGWTGTSIWIDPTTQSWLIILTSRTHPLPAANNVLLRQRKIIANIFAASIVNLPHSNNFVSNTSENELARAYKDTAE